MHKNGFLSKITRSRHTIRPFAAIPVVLECWLRCLLVALDVLHIIYLHGIAVVSILWHPKGLKGENAKTATAQITLWAIKWVREKTRFQKKIMCCALTQKSIWAKKIWKKWCGKLPFGPKRGFQTVRRHASWWQNSEPNHKKSKWILDLIYHPSKYEGCISNQKKVRAISNISDFGSKLALRRLRNLFWAIALERNHLGTSFMAQMVSLGH